MLIVIVIFVLIVGVLLFMQGQQFGKAPVGERLERIRISPNFRNGKFQNLNYTPDLKEGVSYYTVMKDFFFSKSKRSIPAGILPSVKTDLLSLSPDKNVMVWFGHSSYFLQIDGKKILVDPVFSGNASPVKFTTKSFKGSDVYTTDDIPVIDYLFITHDHWDHLDYETIIKLKPKVKKVITGLGVGAHLERWGLDENIIIEKDWNEEVILDQGFIVNTTSARHFSGRGFKRNGALWMSFVLTTPTMKVFLGGDSGYDTHFKNIGETFGPFDLAILECGQYNEYWKYIHMMPEEAVQAALDLKAKVLIPVHWSKFSLALHDWDDSIKRVIRESEKRNMPLINPMIGEEVDLKATGTFTSWWEKVG
ncbi:MBL fold metallo-hydrolase [Segetibacter koreensis]|uniref:MBL fold metallo-hydrolase n=1 Tax=Segetibacter koreensis TaxID=398037 RepID=UPI0003742BF0|nr:MBL fold metallo-hydrolase [Segetibacter koreensis]